MSTQTSGDLLAQLQELVLSSDELGDFLESFTAMLSDLLPQEPGGLGYAVTLIRRRGRDTVAASSNRARNLDELQSQHDDGPCVAAAREGVIVHLEDVASDDRWPAYAAAAAGAGVGSVVAVPLDLEGEARAALNVYAEQPHAFDATAVDAIDRQTQQVTGALRLAVRLARLRDTEADLRAALESRTTINLAVGILMGQHRLSQDRAVRMLEEASNRRNVKLRVLAADLVARVGGGGRPATRFDG